MQFIAECGIEYGCQIVTPFSFNSPDCLYTKKNREILQSYEKTREMQKESSLFFSFPRRSYFASSGKDTSIIYNNVCGCKEMNEIWEIFDLGQKSGCFRTQLPKMLARYQKSPYLCSVKRHI